MEIAKTTQKIGFYSSFLLTVGYIHSFSDASQSFGYLVYNGVIPNYAWAELFSDIILSFLRQSYTKSLLSLNSTSIEIPPIDQQNSEFTIEYSHSLQYSEGESKVIFGNGNLINWIKFSFTFCWIEFGSNSR